MRGFLSAPNALAFPDANIEVVIFHAWTDGGKCGAIMVVEGKRARGWLHRVSGRTAQREPLLSAEVGVQIQEDE